MCHQLLINVRMCWWKTIHVYHLIVSKHQESRHRPAESQDYNLGVGQGCHVPRCSTEERVSPLGYWQNSFPQSSTTQGFSFSLAVDRRPHSSLRNHPQFLVLWDSPTWPFTPPELVRERVSGKMEVTALCTTITGVQPITLAIFYWLKASHRSCNAHKKGSTSSHPEAGIMGSSLRVCQLQSANFIMAANEYTTTKIPGQVEPYGEVILWNTEKQGIPCNVLKVSLTV